MDELLNKFLDGNINEEVFNTELGKLSPEDKAKFDEKLADPEVRKKLTEAGKRELDKVIALRKEGKRLDQKPPEKDFSTKLREENVEKAANEFFSEFGISEAERAHYRELFASNDSGHVSVDLIKKDFARIYSAEHSDELITLRNRVKDMESGAEDFNMRNAGANGSGAGSSEEDKKKYSPAVLDWVEASRRKGIIITPEQAEKILNQPDPMTRKF